jgi:hypothetical protein
MMRYRLRTLLILLAVGPPLVWCGYEKYEAWRADQLLRAAIEQRAKAQRPILPVPFSGPIPDLVPEFDPLFPPPEFDQSKAEAVAGPYSRP